MLKSTEGSKMYIHTYVGGPWYESLPFDEAERLDVERMEQAIEEECERIEPF